MIQKNLGTLTVSTKYDLMLYPSGQYCAVNTQTGMIKYGGNSIENLLEAIEEGLGQNVEISFGSPVRVAHAIEGAKQCNSTSE